MTCCFIDDHWLPSLLALLAILSRCFPRTGCYQLRAEVKCFRKVGNQLNISLGALLDPVDDLEKK